MKIVTIVGARPQFIKAAAVSRAIRNVHGGQIHEVLVHTGQHYDENMSKIFFEELDIPQPAYNLEISGGQHGSMTGRMLEAIEKVLLDEKPDWVLIYGDTNSTLAGALAAAKLHIPIAHVEAGLRSFNMHMPEEINRILSDRVSTLLFCPTATAVNNLSAEGVTKGVHNVGDVMYDVAQHFGQISHDRSHLLNDLALQCGQYALVTCHRAENTDDPIKLESLLNGLAQIAEHRPVVLPLHPRTSNRIRDLGLNSLLSSIKVIDPVSYIDMVALEKNAAIIITDSGGVQKEAFFFGVPCITTRDETEWVETIESGWNVLVGSNTDKIVEAFEAVRDRCPSETYPYGRGNAADLILETLLNAQ